jgi:hypothetical protein
LTFARTANGRYIEESSTATEPEKLIIDSAIKADSTSSIVIKHYVQKNASVGGDPDLVMSNHFVFKWDPDWVESDLLASFNALSELINTPGVLARLMRNER